jgi:hypothetical protein
MAVAMYISFQLVCTVSVLNKITYGNFELFTSISLLDSSFTIVLRSFAFALEKSWYYWGTRVGAGYIEVGALGTKFLRIEIEM